MDRENLEMNEKERAENSRFIALILRAHPEVIGIELDEHGYADVSQLIKGINETGRHHLTEESLEEIVRTDAKQRYSFNDNRTKIRANQGHSIPVDVELKESVPPDVLYHGTSEKSVLSIRKEGLLPMGRLYVHLSKDIRTAKKVGHRHGKPVIYQIDAEAMHRDGHRFWISVNGVWLTKAVPAGYLKELDPADEITFRESD